MAEPYCNSYYAATANATEPFPRLEEAIDVDVAIVGGGFTGIATALELAERGVRVVGSRESPWAIYVVARLVMHLSGGPCHSQSRLGRDPPRRICSRAENLQARREARSLCRHAGRSLDRLACRSVLSSS